MECRASNLPEGCQARAWLPRGWRNASRTPSGLAVREGGWSPEPPPGRLGWAGHAGAAGVSQPYADGAGAPWSGQPAGPTMATGAAWLLGGPWPRRRVPQAVWAAALRERATGRPGVRGKDAWALLTLEYVSG